MRKYELSISSNYVPSWTFQDAIRELLQNAYDEEALDPSNTVEVDYDQSNKSLMISNDKSCLEASSLLLGMSTKSDNTTTIGKFGEGYKLAALVLSRLNKELTILNLGKAEVWRPRFVNSKRYGAPVLTFFVEDMEQIPEIAMPQLSFVIHDVTQEEYDAVVAGCIRLQEPTDTVDTTYGRVLLDRAHRHKIFINGLYVCDNSKIKYGYDFKPQYLKLDRDRKIVADFDLLWLTSKMWASYTSTLFELLLDGISDVEYTYATLSQTVVDSMYARFIEKYGENATPVRYQSEVDALPAGYKPVIVGTALFEVLKRASAYEVPSTNKNLSLLERIRDWHSRAEPELTYTLNAEFEELYNEIEIKLS